MRDRFTVSLQQLDPTMGDLAGNRLLAERAVREAGAVDLVVFPELFITGYPPEDLVSKRTFADRAMAEVRLLAKAVAGGPTVAIGTPWRESGRLTNAVAVLADGEVRAVRHKVELPNYDVFDEKRAFAPGPLPGPVDIEGVRIGFPIGEDIWENDVVECLLETGAEILVVPNGSPYTRSKADRRMAVAVARVVENALPLVYLNAVGGQDELVFDGASFVLSAERTLALQLPAFAPAAVTATFRREADGWVPERGTLADQPDLDEAEWRAAATGLAGMVAKNGFSGAAVVYAGGIDGAVGAAIAVDALGPERVRLVAPAGVDAATLAARLGVRCDTAPAVAADDLPPAALALVRDVALAAFAGAAGELVVAAASKSDVSLGRAAAGDFNPIKDLYRTEVVRLAHWRNGARPAGARGTAGALLEIDDAAALPYRTGDAILKRLVEDEASVAEIVAEGFDAAAVREMEGLVAAAEATRRRAPPGVKLSTRTFGRDRRYPITNRYRDL